MTSEMSGASVIQDTVFPLRAGVGTVRSGAGTRSSCHEWHILACHSSLENSG